MLFNERLVALVWLVTFARKGIWLIFQNGVTWREIVRQRNETATRLDGNREESSFLFNELVASQEFLCGENGSNVRQSIIVLIVFGHLITLLENRRVQLFESSSDAPAYSKPPQVSKVKSL